jgi:hypothetical protein
MDGWRPWHNPVPAWVTVHPAVVKPPVGEKLNAATLRLVLQTIADAGTRDEAGHITGAVGGVNLARASGLAKRTLNRYITYLERHGLVVVLSRGGVLGLGRRGKQSSIANTYGIPAAVGALDQRRVRRRAQTMRPDGRTPDGRTRYVPDVHIPGDQTTLWPQPEQPTPEQAGYHRPGQIGPRKLKQTPGASPGNTPNSGGGGRDTTPVSSGHYGSVPGAHLHLLRPSPRVMVKNHGGALRAGGARKRAGKGAGKLPGVELGDLTDTARLLALYQRCVALGVMAGDPVSRLRFVAAAISARKVLKQNPPGNPCAVFASNVNRKHWLFITDSDEAAAQRLLITHNRRAPEVVPDPGVTAPPMRDLTADAKLLRAARELSRRNGVNAWRLLERNGWDDARYQAAQAELDE